jgi:hypothetical protein
MNKKSYKKMVAKGIISDKIKLKDVKKLSKELGRVNKKMGGSLKPIPAGNKGLPNLPKPVRNKMGFLKEGGMADKRSPFMGGGIAYAGGGRAMKREMYSEGTPKPKPKSEIKKITSSDAYKKADYRGKTKMLGGKFFTRAEMEKKINKK